MARISGFCPGNLAGLRLHLKALTICAVRVVELRVLYFHGLRSDVRYADLLRRAGLLV